MTNRIALVVGGVLFAIILADVALNNGNALLLFVQKLIELIEYLAFWR